MDETATKYDMVYAITTNGCGTLFIEGPDGVVLASRRLSDDDRLEEFTGAVADMLWEAERRGC